MKKKLKWVVNIATLCLCACLAAIGVYAAKNATITAGGTISFNATDVCARVSGTITGSKEAAAQASKTLAFETIEFGFGKEPDVSSWANSNITFKDSGEMVTIQIVIENLATDRILYASVSDNIPSINNVTKTFKKLSSLSDTTGTAYNENVFALSANSGDGTNIAYIQITLEVTDLDTSIADNATWGYDINLIDNSIPQTAEYYAENHKVKVAKVSNKNYAYVSKIDTTTTAGDIVLPKYLKVGEIIYPVAQLGVFSDCSNITSLLIPETIKHISNKALNGCSNLTSLSVVDENSIYDSRDNCNAIIETATNTLVLGYENSTIPVGVEHIGDSAFYYCKNLVSITIPEGVKTIGDDSFGHCENLETVSLSQSLTEIKDNAFESCLKLKNVVIPQNLELIGEFAFGECTAITEVAIPSSLRTLDYQAFWGCTALETVTIEEGLVVIGDYAFEDCTSLKNITIPNSVTTLGHGVFESCNFNSINISKYIKEIGEGVFLFNNATSIVVDPENTVYDSRNNCNAIIETATNTLITGCPETIIPTGIKAIAGFAFYGCTNLKEIVIPEGVETIGELAFIYTENLESISFPNSLKVIEGRNFHTSTKLTNVALGNNIEYIGWSNFHVNAMTIYDNGCYVKDKDGKLAYLIKYAQASLTSCNISNECRVIAYNAFYGSKITAIEIPSSVEVICDGALRASNLKTITFNEGLKKIGKNIIAPDGTRSSTPVFTNSLTGNIVLPNSLEIIGMDVFSGTSITGVTFGSGLKEIGDFAFNNCKKLKNVTILDGVETIRRGVFANCSALTEIILPNSVTSIAKNAFINCGALNKITINATQVPSIDIDTIPANVTQILVPSASLSAYQTAANWSGFASIMVGF